MNSPSPIRIPPKGRQVLCCWAAVPGVLIAPFLFWQGVVVGIVFCMVWSFAVYLCFCRCKTFSAQLTSDRLLLKVGFALVSSHAVFRRGITSAFCFSTPLLRLSDTVLLLLFTPGHIVLLPAIPTAQGEELCRELMLLQGKDTI